MIETEINPPIKWEDFANMRGDALLAKYREIIKGYRRTYEGVIDESKIQKPATLEKIISNIKDIHLGRTDMDIKGGAYEHFFVAL